MSWSRRIGRAGALGGVVLLALGVAACGFQPLYGHGDGASGAQDQLATVRVEPMPDRVGQRLHNLLRDRLNPRGQPVRPAYRLRVLVSETIQELGIRKDETATRANLIVVARFALSDAVADEELFKGRSRSINSYNILESQFATLFSENDARNRALREISDEIRNRLAVYLARVAPK